MPVPPGARVHIPHVTSCEPTLEASSSHYVLLFVLEARPELAEGSVSWCGISPNQG